MSRECACKNDGKGLANRLALSFRARFLKEVEFRGAPKNGGYFASEGKNK